MNRDQIICPCLDITAGQIMDAYKEGVEAIKEVTGAGTACGACLDEIEELIQSL